jgi:hypothetical protein
MKKLFAITTNVLRFTDAMNRLKNRDTGVPGMGLLYGEPGLGKSRTALWWTIGNGGVFIRTKKIQSPRWLLEEIVSELGEAPANRTSDLFRQIQDQLMDHPRPIIIDEADRISLDALETLRDIADITEAPIVCIGMGQADKRLQRHKHLFDRFSEIVKFTELSRADVTSIAEQLCEIPISEDGTQWIHSKSSRFRRVILWFYRSEAHAKRNDLKAVTAADLREIEKGLDK